MRVGLYFGSFNPIHNGHLIIANNIINNNYLDVVWFVVSPQNPFKTDVKLLNVNHRISLIRLAIENEPRISVSNIETCLPKPSYTINTLTYLKEQFPLYEFTIILGSDGFSNIDKWKNAKEIIENYSFIIYKRPGYEEVGHNTAKYKISDGPILNISSTYIRGLIKKGASIRYLVPDVVMEEIKNQGYYLSDLENPTEQ